LLLAEADLWTSIYRDIAGQPNAAVFVIFGAILGFCFCLGTLVFLVKWLNLVNYLDRWVAAGEDSSKSAATIAQRLSEIISISMELQRSIVINQASLESRLNTIDSKIDKS
jgi:hypothetical protein